MLTTPLDLRAAEAPGKWVLTEHLIWNEEKLSIVVPVGFETDLASVPKVIQALPIVGCFYDINGRSRRAAVLHDYLYSVQTFTRKEADAVFFRALAAEGVIAGLFGHWLGVRLGGWFAWRSKPIYKQRRAK
jgi:hypothetical protein